MATLREFIGKKYSNVLTEYENDKEQRGWMSASIVRSVRLDCDIDAKILTMAKEREVTASDIIREALFAQFAANVNDNGFRQEQTNERSVRKCG